MMAMISCPECNREVSEKAYFCPHCGCPIRDLPVPPVDQREYKLRLGSATYDNAFPVFLKILAGITWVGGLILAIVGGKNPLTGAFSFGQFLVLLIPYVINGALLFGFAKVVENIDVIMSMISGIKLEKETDQKNASQKRSVISKRTGVLHAPGKEWVCPNCGMRNPSTALTCKDCGKYK